MGLLIGIAGSSKPGSIEYRECYAGQSQSRERMERAGLASRATYLDETHIWVVLFWGAQQVASSRRK